MTAADLLEVLGVDAAAEQIYREMLEKQHVSVAELSDNLSLTTEEVRDALDQLFELELVRDSYEQAGRIRAVSPEIGLQAALARQHQDLMQRQQQVAASQALVSQMIARYANSRDQGDEVHSERLLGMDTVQDRLARIAQEASVEILSLMPGGAQSPGALEAARRNDAELLERGVAIRTVGLDTIRHDEGTLAYAEFLTDNGAEFRTAPLLPPRMILIDRHAALVPIDPDNTRQGAMWLTSPGTMASLLALFELVWDIATPFGADRTPNREGLTSREQLLLTLLGRGLTDEAAAARIGVSHRTARRMMAELMERLGARSRFEAGLKAAQRGWL